MRLPGTRYSSVKDTVGSPSVEDFHDVLLEVPPDYPTKDAADLWAPHSRALDATDRKRTSVEQVTALVLDYDATDPEAFDAAHTALTKGPLEAYLYRTFTYPRFRVVLPFETAYIAANYTNKGMGGFVRFLLKRTGLPTAGLDDTKLAPESIFYLPVGAPAIHIDRPKRLKAPNFPQASELPSLLQPIQGSRDTPLTPDLLATHRNRLPGFFRLLLNPDASAYPNVPEGKRHRRVYAELRALAPFLRALRPTPQALVDALAPAWEILYPEGAPENELYTLCRDALKHPDPLPLGCTEIEPPGASDLEVPPIPDEDVPPLPVEAVAPPAYIDALSTVPPLKYGTTSALDALEYFLACVYVDPSAPLPVIPPSVDPLHAYHLRLRALQYRTDRSRLETNLEEGVIATLTEKGRPIMHERRSPDFLVRVLECIPAAYVSLRYDTTSQTEYHDLECRPWTAQDQSELVLSLVRNPRGVVPRDLNSRLLEEPLAYVAKKNPIDPFAEYLDACHALYGDTQHFDTRDFLSSVFRVEDLRNEAHYLESLHRWLRGVIARRLYGDAVHIVPVFEGSQGIGKSRSLKILFGSNYVSDLMIRDWASKDAILNAMGSVVVEIPELNGVDPNDLDKIEALKAFITSEVDTIRLPYDKRRTQSRRMFSMYATTNRLEGYLPQDRRFVPIPLAHVDQVQLYRYRDLLLGKLYGEVVSRDLSRFPTSVAPDEPLAAFVRDEVSKRAGAPYWIGILETMLYETDAQRRVDRTRPRYRAVAMADIASRVSEAARRELGTSKIGQVCRQYLNDEWQVTHHGNRLMLSYRGTFATSEDKLNDMRN